jgi:CIC family chloride channel protein
MEDVVKKFDKTNANLLPVLANDGRLIGYITRERVYSMYRKMVADMSED